MHSDLPPYGLILTLRMLVGTADNIVASHTLLSPEPETIWKLWAFTPDSIAFVEAKYETDNYDFGEDDQRRQGNGFGNPAEPASITAWSRPVSTVTAFEIALHLAESRIRTRNVGVLSDRHQDRVCRWDLDRGQRGEVARRRVQTSALASLRDSCSPGRNIGAAGDPMRRHSN